MKFSERKGFKAVSDVIQVNSLNNELRNALWSILELVLWRRDSFMGRPYQGNSAFEKYTTALWLNYFKEPVDAIPIDALQAIRNYYFKCGWYEVYDFIEFTLNHLDDELLNKIINSRLEHELSAYRFVGSVITDITDTQEVAMLEEALTDQDFPSVKAHLRRSLELLSNREQPDYRNSIKESISAVESLAMTITKKPKATLGDALKTIERSGKIHPALREAFSKLYGYTSDEGGIRHAMLDEPDLSAADARFFLLSCTSFINYLKSKV